MLLDASWVYIILLRWLHVVAACLLVGGTFVVAFILPPQNIDPNAGDGSSRSRHAFKMLVHVCILLLLASGIYNAIGNWSAYRRAVPLSRAVFGVHVLLGLAIFTILLVVLARRRATPRRMPWLRLASLLLLITVLVASALKYIREHAK